MSATLTTTPPVWTLNLGDDENRFSPELIADVHAALTEVSESGEPVALQITASGKFFSNGLDLEWLQANPNELQADVTQVHEMLGRVLTLPVPTVCAINGHCFAAGAMLGLACDYRVMRTGRGFFCLPEVDINIPFTAGMSALIQSKLSPRTALDAMTTGERFDATAALDAGIVDSICTIKELADVAHRMVARLAGKDRGTLGAIKSTMFAPVVGWLGSPPSSIRHHEAELVSLWIPHDVESIRCLFDDLAHSGSSELDGTFDGSFEFFNEKIDVDPVLPDLRLRYALKREVPDSGQSLQRHPVGCRAPLVDRRTEQLRPESGKPHGVAGVDDHRDHPARLFSASR